jgi:tRNA 5-methylaminomethyl-2-thiouridine biosynthesis bifunctional protein
MNRENTPWRPVEAAELLWGEDSTPSSRPFDDVYFSSIDALAESRHVFLSGNQLPQRLSLHAGDCFTVCETGFGTGLNFLLTWQAWRNTPGPLPRLHFVSVEKFPLDRIQLTRALSAWPELAELSGLLLDNYPGLLPGQHRLVFDQGRVVLDLWWEDATAAVTDIASHGRGWVDAWYLDGFTPARNELMWQQELFDAMAQASAVGASFATFTAASAVRHGLRDAGFTVTTVPGFGSKRDSLRGTLHNAGKPAKQSRTPWDLPVSSNPDRQQVIVIGAGLAGCHTADALARRGLKVTVLERGHMANAGSGNAQGVLYTRLSRRHSVLTDFSLQSFSYAHRLYSRLLSSGTLDAANIGELCGNFQQSTNSAELAALAPVLATIPELASVLDADQASEITGMQQASGGFWFPGSGWMNPPAVCASLLQSPGIKLIEHCGDIEVRREGANWLALSAGECLAQAPLVVLATGNDSPTMTDELSWLPLRAIRGQTSLIPELPALQALRTALCHVGYIAPARQHKHCIGATFDLTDDSPETRPQDHLRNLQSLAGALPQLGDALAQLDPEQLEGRVGFRCTSPDYLPLVGPVPALDAFLQQFAPLRRNAKQILEQRGVYQPGLYLNTGHGSRGLTSTPIAAELLASQICDEAAPMSRELSRALAPARFLIRNLGRNKL